MAQALEPRTLLMEHETRRLRLTRLGKGPALPFADVSGSACASSPDGERHRVSGLIVMSTAYES